MNCHLRRTDIPTMCGPFSKSMGAHDHAFWYIVAHWLFLATFSAWWHIPPPLLYHPEYDGSVSFDAFLPTVPQKWVASVEAADEIEALRGYVHALAAADLRSDSNLYLRTALGYNDSSMSIADLDAFSTSYDIFMHIRPAFETRYPLAWAPGQRTRD